MPAGAAPDKTPAPPIQGRVVDEAGQPVPGAEIFYSARGDGRHPSRLTADAEGRFSLEPPKGFGFVAAVAPGRALAASALPPGCKSVLLRMGAPREIAGKLLAPDGKPADGVTVRVMSVTQTGEVAGGPSLPGMPGRFPAFLPENARERFTVTTDAAGAYRVPGLPTGPLRLDFRDTRFVTRWLEVINTPPNVRLEPGCRVHGRIAAFDARLQGWRAWVTAPLGSEMAPINPDGTFLLSGLPPGEYPVVILTSEEDTGEELAAVPSVTVTLTPQKPDADAQMRAVPTCLLVGRAVDAVTKAPLPRVPISYNGPHRPANAYTPMVMSGEDGVFRIRMPAGKARLALNRYPREQTKTQAMEVEVAEGRETRVEFLVRDWLTLSGIVVNAEGKPVAGAAVTGEWHDWGGGGAAVTGADGRFRLTGLPSQEVRLSARQVSGDATIQPITVKPPFPAEVRLQIGPLPTVTLVGRVVDDAGRPVAGMQVTLRQILDRQGGQIRSERYTDQATTDPEGRYRFIVHELASEYRVRPTSEDQRVLRGGDPLGDTGAERRFSDLVILSTRGVVTGRAVDANGRPVPGVSVFWASGSKATLAVSDAEGRFRITGLPERPVALVARGPKGNAAFARATPGQEAVLVLKD